MSIPGISSEQLIKTLDEAINDLESNDPTSLFRLSVVFKAIADCNKEQTYLSTFEISIGLFARSLRKAEEITRIPMLESEVRTNLKRQITDSVKSVQSALQIIKTQCSQNINYEDLFKAIGVFVREYEILGDQVSLFQNQQ